MRRLSLILAFFAWACLMFSQPVRSVSAQASSPSELINAVNALRAENGLPPYTIADDLMSIAQAQSDYQASIGTFTHTRPDGSGPGDHHITSENVGGGSSASADYMVRQQWTDYWHQLTLTGFESGEIGAGATLKDGIVYYTLDVRSANKPSPVQNTPLPASTDSSGGQSGSPAIATQPASAVTVATFPPQADGSIIHIVQTGETLWSIAMAYHTSLDTLIALNGFSPTKPVIYEGQKIFVRGTYTRTPTPTLTQTPIPPTGTLKPTRTTRPTRVYPPAATPTPAIRQAGQVSFSPRLVAIIAVVLLGTALYLGVTFGMRARK